MKELVCHISWLKAMLEETDGVDVETIEPIKRTRIIS
jgi:hypothetical protein